jgi:hypothetical protein
MRIVDLVDMVFSLGAEGARSTVDNGRIAGSPGRSQSRDRTLFNAVANMDTGFGPRPAE